LFVDWVAPPTFGSIGDMSCLWDLISGWTSSCRRSEFLRTNGLYIYNFKCTVKYFLFIFFSRFLYPGFLALLVSSISFPLGTGQFLAGELSTHEQVTQLFSNFTWSRDDLTVEQAAVVTHWMTSYTSVFGNLVIYTLFTVSAASFGNHHY